MKFSYLCTLLLILLVSCGKQKFATNKYQESDKTSPIGTYSFHNPSLSQFTYIKPKVDFLIMVDNSGSYNYIRPKIQGTLKTLVDHISRDFDSQIALAPLIKTVNDEYFVIDDDPSDLNGVPSSKIIPLGLAGDKIISFSPGGGKEVGLDRTKDLYSAFTSRKVLRAGSHQMVVLISNGDHHYDSEPTPYDITILAPQKYQEIKNLVSGATHFRFFTVVAHSVCEGVKANYGAYRKVSALFYDDVPNTFKAQYPTYGDSFDICGSFSGIFESINKTIQPVTLRHTYDYWPVVITNDPNYINVNDIDVNQLEVIQVDTNGNQTVLSPSSTNGFEYIGFKSNFEIRESINSIPMRGEPYTGFFIKLNGQAKVTNPVFIKINTNKNTHYYGYVKMDYKPEPGSIKLYIDGKLIPQDSTNGWEYIGGPDTNKNIRIKGVGDYTPETPAVIRSGWFLKLNGNAVYSNNSSINLQYFPQN